MLLRCRTVTVGKSKTDAGTGRVIPLNDRAYAVLKFWAELFPAREPSHYIFPQEKYGLAQCEKRPKGSTHACFHSTDPKKPIGRWKEGWEAARKRADVILKEKYRKGGVLNPSRCDVAFMICGTLAAPECWRAECPFLSSPTSWAGVPALQSAWPNATGTSATKHAKRLWTSWSLQLPQGHYKSHYSRMGHRQAGALTD
jgi:hypothetical protein